MAISYVSLAIWSEDHAKTQLENEDSDWSPVLVLYSRFGSRDETLVLNVFPVSPREATVSGE